ncbi:MAG: ABC transporter ATP-binding protein [Acidimicrobiia bacterium]
MFEARAVESGYGGVTVLKGLDFSVGEEVFAVLGANGAGKSTLMKTIARILPLKAGEMHFKGRDVSDVAPYELARSGMAYVPQEESIFPELTVGENLSIGALMGSRRKQERMDETFELFPDLVERVNQQAGTLSGGEAQMLAVARALMQDPELLLLDEPTAGLAPKYVDGLFSRIKDIHQSRGVNIVLSEQNAAKTLAVADRVMVLSLGRIFLIEATENVDMEALKEGYRI